MDLGLAEQFQEVLLSGGIKNCSQSSQSMRIQKLNGVDALTSSRSTRLSRNINLLSQCRNDFLYRLTMRLRIPALARFNPCI
jgi:hypothetical protein